MLYIAVNITNEYEVLMSVEPATFVFLEWACKVKLEMVVL